MEKEYFTDNLGLKDNLFLSISEAADRRACSPEHLLGRALCGQLAIFAQAVTGTDKVWEGNEGVLAPIFQVSVGQLKQILDNDGATIDPDITLGDNGFIWVLGAPRQIRVEENDLRVLSSESIASNTSSSFNTNETNLLSNDDNHFDPEKYLNLKLSEGLSPEEIIIELVEQYGTSKEKFYGLIARSFCGDQTNRCNSTWRKRGQRMYLNAKKKLAEKNATLPHPSVTP